MDKENVNPARTDMEPPPPPKPDDRRPPGQATGMGPSRLWLWPLMFLAALWFMQLGQAQGSKLPELPYSTLYDLTFSDQVESVRMEGRELHGVLKTERDVEGKATKEFRTVLPELDDPELLRLLREHHVKIVARNPEAPFIARLMLELLPWILILGGWFWLSQRAQRAMGGAGFLGGVLKGRSRRFSEETDIHVSFEDVAGHKSAKRDLREVVEFLKEPERFRRLGAKIPRGILLVGPPGTGKTLLARAVAGEAKVPFFSINGSEFIELFVGVGASRVRELFESAKKVAPAIVFIDELDAVGRARGTGLGGGHDEREQTLNQLLSEMDGFTRNDLTVVLAATNRPDVLDSALLRPGRFDRRVIIDRPERDARHAILEVHTRNKPLAGDVKLDDIAAATPGFSGADLANLVNEAAIIATRRNAMTITAEDFWQAQDKIMVGDPREAPLSPKEKHRIAVHESGHALAAHLSAHAEPVKRISIIPRGMALGATMQLPGEDKHIATRSELEAKLGVLMGGYAAEQLLLGETSSGAQNDLQHATQIAYDMVAHFGMSDEIGPVFYDQRVEHAFLGNRLATDNGLSDITSGKIDAEVQRILHRVSSETTVLLKDHRAQLERLAKTLLERETIEREELLALLGSPESTGVNAIKRAGQAA